MKELKVLRAEGYPRMPWKNGGGSTEEITRDAAVFPRHARVAFGA